MTKKEYVRLYQQARKSFPYLTREAITKLGKVYESAGKLVAEAVRKSKLAGLSDLTVSSWADIERELEAGAALIRRNLESEIFSSSGKGVELTNGINEKYLSEAIEDIEGLKITQAGLNKMFQKVNNSIVSSIVNRVYQDGYNFSERIWNAGLDYQQKIKDVISAGVAQGRDAIKIAKDLQVYIKEGKTQLVNRFGELKRGTREFMRRIGDRVDYRALRLIRSELYASLQEASREQGRLNPACIDLFDWVLSPGRQEWNCTCPSNAANGPYKYNEVPGYPHPHCVCDIRPILMDSLEFQSDLKRWANFEKVDYLDKWYAQQYQYYT